MKLYFTYEPIEAQVVEMTEEEFTAIMDARDTPEFIHIVGTDELHYNTYTCLQGYDGTCRCISHQRKVWDTYSLSDLSSPPWKPESPKERVIRRNRRQRTRT